MIAGKRKDPTLSFQLKHGFVVLDIIPDYMHDAESRNFATLLEWPNPQYVAAVSLHASEQQAELKEVGEENCRRHCVTIGARAACGSPLCSTCCALSTVLMNLRPKSSSLYAVPLSTAVSSWYSQNFSRCSF